MEQDSEMWGEFTVQETKPNYSYAVVIEHAKKPICLDEYLKVVPQLNKNANIEYLIQLPSMEPRMVHTIELHQHACHVSDIIRTKGNLGYRSRNMPHAADAFNPLPIPTAPDIRKLRTEASNQFGFLPKESNEFTQGTGFDLPDIDSSIKNHILSQCIATIFAHIGFETTKQSTLDMMRDVLDQFLIKLCRILRNSVDNSAMNLSDGFPDEMERVFTEVGIGGLRSLHDYYHQRIINYQKVMTNRCQALLKEQEELEKEDVPQIHLSGGEDDHSELRLQPELQMLDYLEQNVEFPLQDLGNIALPSDFERIFDSTNLM